MNIPGRRFMAGDEIVTAPFPRGGDGMFLRAELIDIDGSTDTTIKVFTRNREDNWPAVTDTPIGTLSAGTTPGVVSQLHLPTNTGIKEELRLYIQRAGSGWSNIRILPPLFYDGAVA